MLTLGVAIMFFSLTVGYKATGDYNAMIEYLKNHNQDNDEILLLLNKFSEWKYFYYGYALFIVTMVVLVFHRTRKNISK